MRLSGKLKSARDQVGFSQNDLADKSGVSIQSIKRYETDQGNITIDNLEKIAEALGVELAYFVVDSLPQKSANTVTLRYYPDITAAAGYGNIPENEDFVPITTSKEMLRFMGVNATKNLDLLTIRGGSMEPYIEDGQMAIIEREAKARNGDIVVAMISDELYIKEIHFDPLGRWVQLISKNKHFMDINLEGQEVEMLKVVGVVRGIWIRY